MTAPLTDAELDEIEALCNAAQDGPWTIYGNGASAWIVNSAGDAELGNWLVCRDVRRPEDRAFIARARTALPALIAEVRSLRAKLDERRG